MKLMYNARLSKLKKLLIPLIAGPYKKQYVINTSISTVWDEIRELNGYYNCEVSNIHKKNDDTWNFTFSLLKGRFSKMVLNTINGRAYSRDDSLTIIEIKYGSTVSNIYLMSAVVIMSFIDGFIIDNIASMATKITLMLCILGVYLYVYDRDAKANLIDFIRDMKIEEASEGK